METLRFIDLFAGLGGTRLGHEIACRDLGLKTSCVFTSEIKEYAKKIYAHNFNNDKINGDITKISEDDIPDFDILLGGFPCQAFSAAGKKAGFRDTRGTLFFDVARILKARKPAGFLLENVEGLVKHDPFPEGGKTGKTLSTILQVLKELGYKTSWKVLDAKDFGVPQSRKRIYLVGTRYEKVSLDGFESRPRSFGEIREHGLPPLEHEFTDKLLELYGPDRLQGKSIKDKRGGNDNIHSWNLELKGPLSQSQKDLMSLLLKERRKKVYAKLKGIDWMDGMSLTLGEIHSFNMLIPEPELREMLDDLVGKGYLSFEHPKMLVEEDGVKRRMPATHLQEGYNIVAGKLSFFLNKILADDGITPTIVATETDRIGVVDGGNIRRLSERECLRCFGFPDSYESNIEIKELYDLVGNTVVVPVIEAISLRLLEVISRCSNRK